MQDDFKTHLWCFKGAIKDLYCKQQQKNRSSIFPLYLQTASHFYTGNIICSSQESFLISLLLSKHFFSEQACQICLQNIFSPSLSPLPHPSPSPNHLLPVLVQLVQLILISLSIFPFLPSDSGKQIFLKDHLDHMISLFKHSKWLSVVIE